MSTEKTHGRARSRSKSQSRSTSRGEKRNRNPSGSRRRSDSRYESRERAYDEKEVVSDDPVDKPATQNKWWAIAFLLTVGAYIGLSIYIAFNKLDEGFGGLFSYSISKEQEKVTSGLSSRAEDGSGGGAGSINNSANPRNVLSAVEAGFSLGFFFLAASRHFTLWQRIIAVFWPRLLFGLALLCAAGFMIIAIGVTFVLEFKFRPEVFDPSSAPNPYTSIVPLVILLCAFALWAFRAWGKLEPAVNMLRSARHLTCGRMRHRLWFFIVILILRKLQSFALAWSIISVAAASYAYGPESASCKEGTCGTVIVMCIGAFYILTQYWIAGTICESITSSMAGSFYSKHLVVDRVDTSFKRQVKLSCWRLLGTRARNGLLCDAIEFQVWLITNVIERVPGVKSVFDKFFGWYIRMLARSLESTNRYIGIVSACHNHELSYEETVRRAKPFMKRGYQPGKEDEDQDLGRPMGPLQRRLREERGDDIILDERHWQTGLGAFLEKYQSKSLLVHVALAAATAGVCAVYVIQILMAYGSPNVNGVSWLIVVWGFYAAFSGAYNLLNTVEAAACTMQVWLYDPYQYRSIDFRHAQGLGEYVSEDLQVYIDSSAPGIYDAVLKGARDRHPSS